MVTIKRAELDDVEALVKAEIAAFHHDSVLYPQVEIGGPPGYDSPDVMRRHIRRNGCYKIMEDEQIIGGMVVYVKNTQHCHLDLIFIAPDYHNRGIGQQAMRFLEETYPQATRWTLDTPVWAVRNIYFYEKLGYVKTGEFDDGDITLIAFEKHISPES